MTMRKHLARRLARWAIRLDPALRPMSSFERQIGRRLMPGEKPEDVLVLRWKHLGFPQTWSPGTAAGDFVQRWESSARAGATLS